MLPPHTCAPAIPGNMFLCMQGAGSYGIHEALVVQLGLMPSDTTNLLHSAIHYSSIVLVEVQWAASLASFPGFHPALVTCSTTFEANNGGQQGKGPVSVTRA